MQAPGAALLADLVVLLLAHSHHCQRKEVGSSGGKIRGHSHQGHIAMVKVTNKGVLAREVCLFRGKAELSAVEREKGQHHAWWFLVLTYLIFTGTCVLGLLSPSQRGTQAQRGEQLARYYLTLISGGEEFKIRVR